MHELVLVSKEHDVERISDALMELDALSVSVEDADADTPAEQALFGEPGMPVHSTGWQRSVLRALYSDEEAATAAATLLLAQDWAADVHVQAIDEVPEQDWVRLTQSQFAPVEITESFWIVPSWHEAPPQARQVMRLDPGLAFGTGTHPTTRMCLRWIAQHAELAPDWKRMLDYGCGSGILAVAAALLGARQIDAVDHDPQALIATRDNADKNDVTARIEATLPKQKALPQCDLMLANILAGPLIELAPMFADLVKPGGHIVLSGILHTQAADVSARYQEWFDMDPAAQEDEWMRLSGKRKHG